MAKSLILPCFFFFSLTMVLVPKGASAQLKEGFYGKTCPKVESIVRSTVKAALANDSGVPAALLRLHFHDCFVRGCDASVLIDSTPTNKAEKDSSDNKGISGFEVIDQAKAALETQCPGTVSCADILAFAARDAIVFAGGLYYSFPTGRRDGRISIAAEATANLPGSFFDLAQLRQNFALKGFSLEEMVTLSGAHSIGDSHCSSFSKRLYSFNSTYQQDPSMDPSYARFLKSQCPQPSSTADPIVHFDPTTPTRLDNKYYTNLKAKKGLLVTDQELWTSDLTRKMVKANANHPREWAAKFVAAMVKMGSIEPITGSGGEIRKNCRVVN